MRNSNLLFICVLLFTMPFLAQSANAQADASLTHDIRPFGKYLVAICTLSNTFQGEWPEVERIVTCVRTRLVPEGERRWPLPQATPALQPIDQTITLKLVCDPSNKNCDQPAYPLVAGKDFFVSAKADSGRAVRQTVFSGNATPVGGRGTVQYHANSPGYIIIRAATRAEDSGLEQPPRASARHAGRAAAEDSQFNQAAPVDLILQVVADAKKIPKPCTVLPPDPPPTATPLDAATIVSLLGAPTPFVLSAQGPNTIAVYTTRQSLRGDEPKILDSFQDAITALAGRTTKSLGISASPANPFTVELRIPHGAALGDLATRVNGLNYSQFTVQDVGSDQVRVTAPAQPDCDTWKSFLTDIRHMAWNLVSVPLNKKLFYLSSSDVVAGFSALPAPVTPAASPSPSAPNPPASAPSAASPASPTISVTQPPGSNIQINSDTTPCVVAGLAFGNTNACGFSATAATTSSASTSSPAATPAAAPASPAPLGMASVAVAAGLGEQTPPDLLVFSDTNPGDDAQVQERLRIIAQLDLPRPEMIINAWVTQNSTSSPQATGAFTNLVKGIVADYNQQFENVVLKGWASIKKQSLAHDDYFNEAFRSYLQDRFVSDGAEEDPGSTPQQMSQAFLDNSPAKLAYPIQKDKLLDPKICPRNHYCLGYNSLFNPLRPALTDLLLAVIAAQRPEDAADIAIAAIEAGKGGMSNKPEADAFVRVEGEKIQKLTVESCNGIENNSGEDASPDGRDEARNRCRAIWRNLDLDHATLRPFAHRNCADLDYRGILYSLLQDAEPRIHLQCFKEEVGRLLAPGPDGRAYGVGVLRSAIADFLYNYKISQHYPHEFQPYDLSQTADALNAALNPLIEAFNRDITSYQIFIRADMQYQVERLNSRTDGRCCVKRLFGLDKPSFFNDGLITVRTISGQATTVNTTSQSSLNVSTAPELTSLLNQLTGLTGSPSGSAPPPPPSTTVNVYSGTSSSGSNPLTSTSPAPPAPYSGPGAGSLASTILGASPLGRVTALAGLLSNYQTTFAQIGRSLNLSVLPRSLSTASSAEIAVTLNADESAAPSFFNVSGAATDPALNISRVANHDTTTRVRIDSVKLFEISSLTAVLEHSRSRFPLLPPFVEIPYIGTLAGIPLGAAKEFHNSTAILSAYVVPTAADIAYGLRFVSDLVVDSLNQDRCSFYKGAAGPDVKDACLFRKALSLHDFGYRYLNNFNRVMVNCFANDNPSSECQRITLDDVPSMH